jgi:hypothetical protein
VRTRREGRTVYYRLRDPRLVEACELTRSILVEGMEERGTLGRSSKRPTRRIARRSEPTDDPPSATSRRGRSAT